ncbi:MAG: ribosome biogenesis GTPase Der [Planctomycetes bacterium]|nr:ribosome biogenesis GTPase Der [Planctomycetota bacterium]
MPVPVVAIIGRPNVGKSSLFNYLVGRRVSIVEPTAGVTRDRVTSLVEVKDRFFDLTDTGGIGIVDLDNLAADVEKQIQSAIDLADVILFVVDARSGPTPLDEVVASRLRKMSTPIICVVNKCDTEKMEMEATEFHRFGYQPVIPVSAEQHRGKGQLLAAILKRLPDGKDEVAPDAVHLELAIVGRRNAGKSTFINSLAKADRVIVSEIPGTTRDSVDVRFERDGKTFIAIDTAGVRHRSSLANSIEFYSMARAERSIRRAEVVLHFFDASLKISRVDKQLTEYILEHHKPAIFVMNKWDLLKDEVSTADFAEYVKKNFPMLDHVPIAFISAMNSRNVHKVLNLAQQLVKQANTRVTTGELNRTLRMAVEANPPTMKLKRQPKIYYATQIAVAPPTIVIFTNGPHLFESNYVRYLTKVFRNHLPFTEVAIKLELRSRKGAPSEDDLDRQPKIATELEKPKRERRKKNTTPEVWDV